jgi:hypothetical protein
MSSLRRVRGAGGRSVRIAVFCRRSGMPGPWTRGRPCGHAGAGSELLRRRCRCRLLLQPAHDRGGDLPAVVLEHQLRRGTCGLPLDGARRRSFSGRSPVNSATSSAARRAATLAGMRLARSRRPALGAGRRCSAGRAPAPGRSSGPPRVRLPRPSGSASSSSSVGSSSRKRGGDRAPGRGLVRRRRGRREPPDPRHHRHPRDLPGAARPQRQHALVPPDPEVLAVPTGQGEPMTSGGLPLPSSRARPPEPRRTRPTWPTSSNASSTRGS